MDNCDFDAFTYNVPKDSRLPGGGGNALTFYDIKPAKFGLADNFLTFANNVGGAFNRFNGFDVTLNARLRDVTVQGGTGGFLDTFLGGLGQWPQQFCHRESGWKTNVKGLASHNVPKIDMLLSGTFRSLPYAGNEFPSVQSQSLGGQVLALNIPGGPNDTSLARAFGSASS